MSDRTQLKVVALVWAIVAIATAFTPPDGPNMAYAPTLLELGFAGAAYIASFFARGEA